MGVGAFAIFLGKAGALELPSIFSDEMVLQQEQPLPVWGRAKAGERVTVEFREQTVEAEVDAEGKWLATLAPEKAGGTPTKLRIRAGEKEVIYRDVLVGEVWLCSGQSNMQMLIRESGNPDLFALAGADPWLRFYTVDRVASPELRFSANSTWVEAKPASITDFSAVGYHFGALLRRTLNVPVGLIHASWGETPAIAWTRPSVFDQHPLFMAMVEEWEKGMPSFPERNEVYLAKCAEWNKARGLPPEAKVNHWANPQAPKPPPYDPNGSKRPGNLAMGMLGPVAPFAIRGVIWYQGENDTTWFPARYDERLRLMVDDWRLWWNNPQMAFGVVQLASHGQPDDQSKDEEWAALRESQRRFAANDRFAGLAVALDVGEANNIHPFDKETVGQRLARWALTDVYRKLNLRGGPEPVEATFGETVKIRFASVGSGLWAFNGPELRGFTLAGSDGVFHPAKAQIQGKETLEVSTPAVVDPQVVRYAWARNPLGANLANQQRLPAPAFELRKADNAAPIPECQARNGWPNFFAKLEAGQTVRVAYLGGSITEASRGWRDLSRNWLAEQYPQARVEQIRATISGTGAEFGACRLKNHVLRHAPDLVLIEFAVNGAGKTDRRAIESMEGIVRQIRRHNPETEVGLVFTLHQGMVKELKAGRLPPVVTNMQKVAEHYGVPTINFGPEVVRLLQTGRMVFSGPVPGREESAGGPVVFSTDGTHPLEAGHQLYLESFVRSISAIKAAGQPGPHPLPEPLEPNNWENGNLVAIDAEGVVREGGWQQIEPPDGTEQRQRISDYFPSVWAATKPGDALEFTFEGVGFGLSGFRGPAAGVFQVTVDDRPPLEATFFDAYSHAGRVSHKAWFYPEELAPGKHRVKIEFLSKLPDHEGILRREGQKYSKPASLPEPVFQLAAILLAGSLVK